MDRRVKERLIGATILVVLIVLIVPELLSGPKRTPEQPAAAAGAQSETLRNVTVDLATSKATPLDGTAASSAASAVPGAPPDASAVTAPETGDRTSADSGGLREPERSPPVITTLKAQPSPSVDKAASAPISPMPDARSAGAREATSPSASRHGWAVQLGSFSSRSNAEKQMSLLKGHDTSAYLSAGGKGSALRYRVRVGPFADRGAAERALSKLRKEGLTASLVPP